MTPPRYKWAFSVFHLTEETSKEITKLQTVSKGLFAILGTSTYLTSSANYTLLVGLAALFVDTLLSCFYVEKIK